jgi:hypothetical protein
MIKAGVRPASLSRVGDQNIIATVDGPNTIARVHRFEGGHEFSLVEAALPTEIADAAEFLGATALAP